MLLSLIGRGICLFRLWRLKHVRHIDLNSDGSLGAQQELFGELDVRFRDVRSGPDGFLYLLTEEPDSTSRILRVIPKAAVSSDKGSPTLKYQSIPVTLIDRGKSSALLCRLSNCCTIATTCIERALTTSSFLHWLAAGSGMK